MSMRIFTILLAAGLAASAVRAGTAETVTNRFTVDTDIPEGNPVGLVSVGTFSGLPAGSLVTDLAVGLTVSGGYNGGLYAYLEAPNGLTVTLLNDPGTTDDNPFGFGGSGLAVWFTASAEDSIQTTAENPGEVTAGDFLPADSLTGLTGAPADGEWKVFISDETGGGGQAVLTDWSVAVTAEPVPEPAGAVLIWLAAGAVVLRLHRRTTQA